MSTVESNELPPNQVLTAQGKWPIVGEKSPARRDAPWTVKITGLVDSPQVWSLAQLLDLPRSEHLIDIHCVTRWSKLQARFAGILLCDLLDIAGPQPQARFLSFVARSERNHSTSLPLQEALDLNALVALEHEGEPLPEDHGGPVRMIVPGRYFYKSVKWLERIEVLAEDRLGYWEAETGYHNEADPWKEQRYAAPNLDRALIRELLASRDFGKHDLRSLDAAKRDLRALQARGTLLRDANFRGARLSGACFDGANLSNAHFQGADLYGASFRAYEGQPTDAEGADFRGADLRGATFEGASLFGVTFCPEPGTTDEWGPALMDSSTTMDADSLATLEPLDYQHRFVLERLQATSSD